MLFGLNEWLIFAIVIALFLFASEIGFPLSWRGQSKSNDDHLGNVSYGIRFFLILVITLMPSGAWTVFWKSSFQISGRTLILVGFFWSYFSELFAARNKFIKEDYRNRLVGLPYMTPDNSSWPFP
jgi:hypothetical protein